MAAPLDQHQKEIEQNLARWKARPLLQNLYAQFYQRIASVIDRALPGPLVEIGSGIGNLRSIIPNAICTDLFPNPWLDLVCDGYELPFADGSLSHLVLFDVFHHIEAPVAFLAEAERVLTCRGRVILFEPYLSWLSWPAYGIFHHEPVGWNRPIRFASSMPRPRTYYAAQGNATRLFFGKNLQWLKSWEVMHQEAFSTLPYLLSGGYSKPGFWPPGWIGLGKKMDKFLSRWPRLFAGRALIVLERNR